MVEGDGGYRAGRLSQEVEERFGAVVGLDGAAGDVDDGQPAGRAPVPAQVVGEAHGPGGVAGHGVDAAVGGTGADGDDGPGAWGQPVDPAGGGDGLTGVGVGAEAGPAPLDVARLVGDGALDDEDEGVELTGGGGLEPGEELVAHLVGEHRVMEADRGTPGKAPKTRSSRLGWVAAVMAMESPSQLRPAVSQSTGISSSTGATVRGYCHPVRDEVGPAPWVGGPRVGSTAQAGPASAVAGGPGGRGRGRRRRWRRCGTALRRRRG